MKYVLYSLAMIACIPLIALALEPTNPTGFCGRFIGENEIKNCEERVEKEEVDWYAATVCNLQKDDTAFWNCWDSVKGKSFNPQSLEKCGEDSALSDQQRISCVQSAQAPRKPASTSGTGLFQPLKTKKSSAK